MEPFEPYAFDIHDDALDLILTEARGFPYFLQIFGRELWNAAPQRCIDLSVARAALAAGQKVMDAGIFRARWDRTTPDERMLLRAMVQSGVNHPSASDLAGVNESVLVATRSTLLAKGIVYIPEPGTIAFTMPGMPSFIARREA